MLATRTLDELSVEDIAHEAGISRGLLFHYFASKQEFHLEVARAAAARAARAHRARPGAAAGRARCARRCRAFIDYVEENPDNYKSLVRGAASGDAEMRAIFDDTRAAHGRSASSTCSASSGCRLGAARRARRPRLGRLRRGVRHPLVEPCAATRRLLDLLTKSLPALVAGRLDDAADTLVSTWPPAGHATRRRPRNWRVAGELGCPTMAFTVAPQPQSPYRDERAEILAAPGFGKYFTDHMVRIDWTADGGWGEGQVLPYGPLTLDPATMVLHYGQEIFEGLKAYRQPDGSIADVPARRQRRPLPALGAAAGDGRAARGAVRRVAARAGRRRPRLGADRPGRVAVPAAVHDRDRGRAGRARRRTPTPTCSSPRRPARTSPGGVKPVSVWLSTEYTRAAPGGTGEAKCGGNYAASLIAQAYAAEQGCDQVVWLDAAEHRWVEEMGGMNLYFVYGSGPTARIVTPALTGTLLPGVTRDSLLTLAGDLGYAAEEGKISTDEWQPGNISGERPRGRRADRQSPRRRVPR